MSDETKQEPQPSTRFSYTKFDEQSTTMMQGMRKDCEYLETTVNSIPGVSHQVGRAKALALTYLEIAYMWMGKAVRDAQIERTGKVDEQPERNNE